MFRFEFTHEDIGLEARVNWDEEKGVLKVVKIRDVTDKGFEIPLDHFSEEELEIIEDACLEAAKESSMGWREVA